MWTYLLPILLRSPQPCPFRPPALPAFRAPRAARAKTAAHSRRIVRVLLAVANRDPQPTEYPSTLPPARSPNGLAARVEAPRVPSASATTPCLCGWCLMHRPSLQRSGLPRAHRRLATRKAAAGKVLALGGGGRNCAENPSEQGDVRWTCAERRDVGGRHRVGCATQGTQHREFEGPAPVRTSGAA
ncbi:hypothetical protein B0H15DRAFT_840409 [Mycena belliarum]|uniref:Uncharacterized protein n=1 Tax=Mycena belliarum TaxID=1033014 RepID=A0AAD6XJM3_9AGAR|nr:hypothetical protein B0H15DRAFT_858854 [Mycena belliae]KAJ7079282.1 hypothetical protein B0H15DRAFT_858890 [Mycena belliae]KAJ7089338.1 hypothetical protein B0H15DRAFT_840409 [Mycena belliae]